MSAYKTSDMNELCKFRQCQSLSCRYYNVVMQAVTIGGNWDFSVFLTTACDSTVISKKQQKTKNKNTNHLKRGPSIGEWVSIQWNTMQLKKGVTRKELQDLLSKKKKRPSSRQHAVFFLIKNERYILTFVYVCKKKVWKHTQSTNMRGGRGRDRIPSWSGTDRRTKIFIVYLFTLL